MTVSSNNDNTLGNWEQRAATIDIDLIINIIKGFKALLTDYEIAEGVGAPMNQVKNLREALSPTPYFENLPPVDRLWYAKEFEGQLRYEDDLVCMRLVATRMLIDCMPIEKVTKYTNLPFEAVKEILSTIEGT